MPCWPSNKPKRGKRKRQGCHSKSEAAKDLSNGMGGHHPIAAPDPPSFTLSHI